MRLLLLVMFSTSLSASNDAFFPKYRDGQVVEERVFDKDKIERGLELYRDTYRYVVNYKNLSRMPMEVAFPIHQLSQYSTCMLFATQPLQVNIHFEPNHVETNFRCVTPPDYDPVKLRKKMQDNFCADGKIRSRTQEILCKELLLR